MVKRSAKRSPREDRYAGIEYMGIAGGTSDCVAAIVKLLHFGDTIHKARLLSCIEGKSRSHGFLLTVNHGDIVGIKSGFSSGYEGTGPHGLSTALQLLARHQVEIDEYDVDPTFLQKLDSSNLLRADLMALDKARAVRPLRYLDYVHSHDLNLESKQKNNKFLNENFPTTMPFGILDDRLTDLALKFPSDPDGSILTAYRRLEDIVKDRTGIKGESGARLFSAAFLGKVSPLHWNDDDPSEQVGKGNMFTAIFGAYRNPRSHRESSHDQEQSLREFLLINELFLLEKVAIKRTAKSIANEKRKSKQRKSMVDRDKNNQGERNQKIADK